MIKRVVEENKFIKENLNSEIYNIGKLIEKVSKEYDVSINSVLNVLEQLYRT